MQINTRRRHRRVGTSALLFLFFAGFAASGWWTSSIAEPSPADRDGQPVAGSRSPEVGEGGWRADTLIVVANPRASADDLQDVLQEAKGTIERRIKSGDQEFLVIKTEKGKLEETFKNFSKDSEHFSLVQRNYTYKRQQCNLANDPAFPSQYELNTLSVPGAWCNNATGQNQVIAILDTGVNGVADLNGKLLAGFNAFTGSGGGNHDTDPGTLGHGTACASTAAAAANNSVNSASPAFNAQIYPVIISAPDGRADDVAVIAAIGNIQAAGIRIASCSFNAVPPYSFSNARLHPALHVALNGYYNAGGLFFNAAGNERKAIRDVRRNNLIVIAAIDSNLKIASFSNTGSSVWYAAPGVLTQCSDKNGNAVRINGTSFSTPLVASLAAMIRSKYAGATNVEILNRLTASSFKPKGFGYMPVKYGLGIPRAQLATQ